MPSTRALESSRAARRAASCGLEAMNARTCERQRAPRLQLDVRVVPTPVAAPREAEHRLGDAAHLDELRLDGGLLVEVEARVEPCGPQVERGTVSVGGLVERLRLREPAHVERELLERVGSNAPIDADDDGERAVGCPPIEEGLQLSANALGAIAILYAR